MAFARTRASSVGARSQRLGRLGDALALGVGDDDAASRRPRSSRHLRARAGENRRRRGSNRVRPIPRNHLPKARLEVRVARAPDEVAGRGLPSALPPSRTRTRPRAVRGFRTVARRPGLPRPRARPRARTALWNVSSTSPRSIPSLASRDQPAPRIQNLTFPQPPPRRRPGRTPRRRPAHGGAFPPASPPRPRREPRCGPLAEQHAAVAGLRPRTRRWCLGPREPAREPVVAIVCRGRTPAPERRGPPGNATTRLSLFLSGTTGTAPPRLRRPSPSPSPSLSPRAPPRRRPALVCKRRR